MINLNGLLGRYSYLPYFGIAVILFMALVLMIVRPLHSAIEIGGDEDYEVTKGFLWVNGYPPYEKMWNDQPPLYTALLAICFKCFGSTIGVARCLAVGFGLLLLSGCFISIKKRCGEPVACVATFCLLTAPLVFGLCVSAMLEVPAIATALWSLWPIYRWAESRERRWLVISGLVLSVALQIKMTAAILVPPLAVEILMSSQGTGLARIKVAVWNLAIWGGCMVSGLLLLGMITGVNYSQALNSHFSANTLDQTLQITTSPLFGVSLVLSPKTLPWHVDAWAGAGIGLLIMILRGDWRRLTFPLVLLPTAITVHLLHRPYWGYYYLHFALPLAWLTGYGMVELYRYVWKSRDNLLRPPFVTLCSLMIASVLAALIFGNGGGRLITEVLRIQNLPRVENSPLIAEMSKYRSQTKWVFTPYTIYPFHAKMKVIPELAVMPIKRFWSGQLTYQQMWETVEKYRPEQILLNKTSPAEAKDFIESNYVIAYQDDQSDDLYAIKGHCLYVLKSLAASESVYSPFSTLPNSSKIQNGIVKAR